MLPEAGEEIRVESLEGSGDSEKRLRYAEMVSAAGIAAIREDPTERGKAQIEKIIPEANTMPLSRLLNDPFAGEMTSRPPQHVKPTEDMATESVKEAA